ncbi:MAG: hypothetical protein ABR584_05570 [Candidatus Baltobacteraceae bacterium]
MKNPEFPTRSISRFWAGSLLGLSCAVFALASAFAPSPASSALPQAGLAYDEVTRVIMGENAPEPGTFTADFQAAVNAQRSAAAPGTHRGLLGGIMNTIDMAKNGMNFLKNGSASSKYYLAGWERTDDPGAQTATITKPRERQIISLNLAKKTYHVVDPSAQTINETPPPMDRARNAAGPSQPGSGKLDINVSNTSLGPRVIDNIPTTGYKLTFNLTESQSTGSCSDGTFQTSMIEYVSAYAQPRMASSRIAPVRPMMRPELMALKPGCAPTIRMHSSGGAHLPADRLALWTLVVISGGAPTAQGEMRGGFSTLIERGNVHALGAADKNLFSIPADFTKDI